MKFQARNNYLINWPEYPLLRITICFILGIYISDVCTIALQDNLMILSMLIVGFIFVRFKDYHSINRIRILSALVLLLGISLGVFRGNLQKVNNDAKHFSNHLEKENYAIGKIDSELKSKKRVSAQIEVLQLNGKKCRGKMLVYFSPQDSQITYDIGDVIAFEGSIQILNDNANPKSFNYKAHLKYKGINYQLFLKEGKHKLLSNDNVNVVRNSALKIRKWALSIFEKRLKNKNHLATASAMVLGYREYLSDELYASFSETGSVHVLAVSGLHVGIICMIFIFLFDRIKIDTNAYKVIKLITLLLVVWTYAMVTGASPAVLRASVMFSFILIGRLWFKGANIYNILAFSALLILLYDPYLLFQLSFQFSYLALISIVFFQSSLERLYETKHWLTTKIWKLTTVSIAAQVLIFPISIFYFNKFPTYFIISGIAAVFMATFILSLGLLLICSDKIPHIGDWFSKLYSTLLEVFIKTIEAIHSLPFNSVEGIYISNRSVFILYLLIGTGMLIMSIRPKGFKDVLQNKFKRKQMAWAMVGVCIIFLFSNNIFYTYKTDNHVELIVYDISKGTALDVFCGDQLYTKQSQGIEEKKIDFANKSYRIYNGDPRIKQLDVSVKTKNAYFEVVGKGVMVFKNKRLVFVDELDPKMTIPCASDIVFVLSKTKMSPYEFLNIHVTSKIVLDNSLNFKIKNQWIKECGKRNIDVHDIRKNGVFRI